MTETFQITADQAEFYDAFFVPAIFAAWAPMVAEAAAVAPGLSVLDVACGTGVAAREAAARLAGAGSVVGTDLNPAMLAVAARVAPHIEWRQADAAHQPFDDASFDVVLCQSALMFFPDPDAALREMARVVRPGGRVVVQVYAGLDAQPAYSRLVAAAARHAGPEAVSTLSAYWVHGDRTRLSERLRSAGLQVVDATTRTSSARFPSVADVVRIEVGGSPLAQRIDPAVYRAIEADAVEALAEFTAADGIATLPLVGHIITATPAR